MAKKTKPPEGAESAVENTEPKASTKPEKYDYVIKNKKARALTKHRKAVIIAGIILLLILLLVGIFYGFYSAVDANNFRIFVDRSGSKVLSLSMNPTMEPASELIEIVGPSKMTNTTIGSGLNIVGTSSIEDRIIDIISTDGSFTTVDDYFIAGTFYIKNLTTETKVYSERLKFEECSKGTAKALRVMVVRENDITVYAHPQTENGEVLTDTDGNALPEEVVPNKNYAERYLSVDEEGNYSLLKNEENKPWTCENFFCNESGSYEDYAIFTEGKTINSGEILRYSIVIWFEGWDKQCVDDILDGVVRMNLSFACE